MTTRVKNFDGFMKSRSAKVNEQYYGANPEEDFNPEDLEGGEGEGEGAEGEGEEEPVTLEDLKAMVEDLTERVEKLEGGEEEGEGEEGAEEGEEGEGEEGAEEGAEEE
jgi:hypothetical protein